MAQQRSEMQAEFDRMKCDFSRQDELKQKKLEDAKLGDLQKDQIIAELKKQFEQIFAARSIDVSILVQNSKDKKKGA